MSWDISLGVGWRGRKTIFFKICFICDKTVNSRNNPKPKVNRLAIDFQTAQRMDWSEGSAILHSTSTKNIYFQLVKNVKWNANFIHLNSFLSFFYCTWTSVSLTFFSLKHKLKGFNLNLPPPPSGQCVLLPVQWNILFPVVVAPQWFAPWRLWPLWLWANLCRRSWATSGDSTASWPATGRWDGWERPRRRPMQPHFSISFKSSRLVVE